MCDPFAVDFSVRMNKTSGPVDVWEVDGVDINQMRENSGVFSYLPGVISVDRITLVQRDVVGGDMHPRDD